MVRYLKGWLIEDEKKKINVYGMDKIFTLVAIDDIYICEEEEGNRV